MNTINVSIMLVALLICVYIAIMIIRKQPLFSKVNNIIMEGEVKGGGSKYVLILLSIITLILILSTLLIIETKSVSVVQTVNINSGEAVVAKININEASVEELMLLDGIGLSKANRIVTYREKVKFSRVSELINVLGETTYNKIKDSVCLEEDK